MEESMRGYVKWFHGNFLSTFIPFARIPESQLVAMSDISPSFPACSYSPTAAISFIKIWFMGLGISDESANLIRMMYTQPHLIDPLIPTPPTPPPPFPLQSCAPFRCPLIKVLNQSLVFKIDKPSHNGSSYEHSAYKRLLPLPNPYYVTACVRAMIDKSKPINPSPPPTSSSAQNRQYRAVAAAAAPPSSSSLPSEPSEQGLLMERCVGSLCDAINSLIYFENDLKVKKTPAANTAFCCRNGRLHIYQSMMA
jgi:hypothetical protein